MCDHRFERLVKRVTEGEETLACPECGATEIRRLISVPAVLAGESRAAPGEREAEASEPSRPPVFGRKELQQALRERGY